MDKIKQKMQCIAESVKAELPDNFGFIVMVFPFGQPEGEARCNYVSNAEREDALNVLKEFLIKAGYNRDWMKHLR